MNPILKHPVRAHWFFLIAPIVVAGNIFVALTSRGEIDRLLEAGLLFDLAVLLPCLYWLCYKALGKKAAVRAGALFCLGIWGALKLVPEAEQNLLTYVAPLRYVGLAALVWIEFAVLLAIYRSIFKSSTSHEAAARVHAEFDMPPWVARLLVLEAMFWRRVWQGIKRILGRI